MSEDLDKLYGTMLAMFTMIHGRGPKDKAELIDWMRLYFTNQKSQNSRRKIV